MVARRAWVAAASAAGMGGREEIMASCAHMGRRERRPGACACESTNVVQWPC